MIFSSKGFKHATQSKGAALEAALLKASEGGKLPIVVDTSPCLAQIKGDLTDGALKCAPDSLGELREQGAAIDLYLCDGQVWGSVRLGIAWLVADSGGLDSGGLHVFWVCGAVAGGSKVVFVRLSG